jgi:hypothetical protein
MIVLLLKGSSEGSGAGMWSQSGFYDSALCRTTAPLSNAPFNRVLRPFRLLRPFHESDWRRSADGLRTRRGASNVLRIPEF